MSKTNKSTEKLSEKHFQVPFLFLAWIFLNQIPRSFSSRVTWLKVTSDNSAGLDEEQKAMIANAARTSKYLKYEK